MEKFINVISFDVPYPANYGGIIDVFYKLKALKQAKINVILHCFEYGRAEQKELEKYAAEVCYYKRSTSATHLFSRIPFIVKTRTSERLKHNLLKNDYPILFEGLHTCYLMSDLCFKKRKKIYRESNIEHEYYLHLAKAEKNKLKKIFFESEAKKLERFEKVLKNADKMLIVSETEAEYFKKKFPSSKVIYLPSFHENEKVTSKKGRGKYILYHGKLSVPENEAAAKFLILHVFSKIDHPVVIAGMNPSKSLIHLTKEFKNIQLISNPSDEEMKALMSEAHLHCLYTEQATGLKLKLLNVLFQGRHVLVNKNMTTGTSLENACYFADDPESWIKNINKLMQADFNEEDLNRRNEVLQSYLNNNQTEKLIKAVWD